MDDKDSPDPFEPDETFFMSNGACAMSTIQPHLLTIYAVTTWLHLQWHLPRAACNALLSILGCLLLFVSPQLEIPFRTLQSATRVLALDTPFYTLPCCPTCREVYPPAGSTHEQDHCMTCNIPLFLPDTTKRGFLRAKKIPYVKYPYLPLSVQIQSILMILGVEATLDGWRSKPRTPGQYTDIFDGNVCRLNLKAPDGTLFFSNSPNELQGPNNELRLGVNLGIDWFSYIRSNIAPSHSSCPTSFSICNLPPKYRYRTSNLISLTAMEAWHQGTNRIVSILNPQIYPKIGSYSYQGRLVRVALVAVVCDKPAAHKIGGFGSHSHTNLCTACWITQVDKARAAAFVKDAFKERTNLEQRELGEQYRQLTTPTARKNFVKDFATCYTQLARLPYFDLVNQVVIDPMHNLFLGLVKTHFYNIWVQGKVLRPNHELTAFHEMLANFTLPSSCGKLPKDIGMPSGGSLTADQWLLLSTVYGPIVIPQLWSACAPSADSNHILQDHVAQIERLKMEKTRQAEKKIVERRALEAAKKQGKEAHALEKARIAREKELEAAAKNDTRLKAAAAKQVEKVRIAAEKKAEKARISAEKKAARHRKKVPHVTDTGDEEEELKFGLHPDDPANFLKLSGALRILMHHTLSDTDIDCADTLIRQYATELLKLYGSNIIKPNHHYATHIVSFVRNFGPLHNFWTFLFECLNKVLKSFKTNNHGDGELETTFFSEFHRTCESSHLTYALLQMPKESLPCEVAEHMLKASSEERGTVAALAALSTELDEVNADAGQTYALSPRRQKTSMTLETCRLLAKTLCFRSPQTPVHC
ncbi:uncharacterized protein EDB91DRAFT_1055457 [Suillus paluster]|uniref:uncharacterized protein n=1 Tax=Suillus paluster TaxID=48578 RepID=UPI001B862129|nr:uncharacterized protein EDB91DRAFT_1055457 [Suillus paluster]KAG1736838.1 hypothetical protein EDB91DRAFT_1055457 [Suillus paluster]